MIVNSRLRESWVKLSVIRLRSVESHDLRVVVPDVTDVVHPGRAVLGWN